MDVNNVLEITLAEILNVIRPSRDDWVIRSQILEDLQALVTSLENLRGAVVEPFGSFVSNLFTQQGDLDISIDLPYNSYIASSGKKHKQALLGEVLKALRRRGGVRRLQFIYNARVPILKFESDRQAISCDVSIDNFQGQMKSKLFFWLSRIDGRFRDMILIVKEWAKAHSINDSKTGTLNSYSLCLLVVLHFQTCAPAIFPPLMDIYPGNIVDDLKGVRADAERRIEEICVANIARFSSDKQRVPNRSTLSELFISFLAKFSDISLKASELGICTYMGQWQDIQSNMRWLPKTYALHIEDPFEQPENTARSVSTANLKKISEAFGTTYSRLAAPYLDRNSLLAMLVKPQTFYYLTGTSLRGFLHNNGHQFNHANAPADNSSANADTHPQRIRAVNPQVQQQQQQKKKNSRRANGKATMQGTAQSVQMQRVAQPNQTQRTTQPIQMQSQAQRTIQPSLQRPTQPNQTPRPTQPIQMQSQAQRTIQPSLQRPTQPIQMQSQAQRTIQQSLQRPTHPNQMRRPTHPNQMQSLIQISSLPYQMQNQMQISPQQYQMQVATMPYRMQTATQAYPMQRTDQPNQMHSQMPRAMQPNQSRGQQMWRQKSDREA